MKGLKIIGTVAAGVALVATGAGVLGLGLSLPALGLGSGVIAGSTIAGYAAIAAAAANLGSSTLSKPPPARGSVAQIVIEVDPPRPFVMGEGYVGGVLRYDEGYGATLNKVPNPYLWQVYVYSGGGGVQSITPYVDFEAVGSWFSTFLYTSTQLGACPEATAVTPHWAGAPGWTTASKLSGSAAIGWNALFDKDGKRFASGLPVFGAYGQWEKAYDPRKDSTRPGGSGTHRVNDQATWEWTNRPALYAGSYAYGYRQNGTLVIGMGLDDETIDWDYIADWANTCDANDWSIFGRVFEPVGPEQRWANLKDICLAGGGQPIFAGGKLTFLYPSPRISLGTLTVADLAEGRRSIKGLKGYADRVNTITPKCIDPANNWELLPGAKVSVSSFLTEDGEEKLQEWPLNLVKDFDQGAQIAAYKIWDSRELSGNAPLLPTHRTIRPGECWTFDLPDQGLEEQDCIITKRTTDPATFGIAVEFETETAGKHDYALGRTGTPPPTPALGQTAEERDAIAAAAIAPKNAARALRSQDDPFPISSDDDQIDIAAFNGVLNDGTVVAFPADSLTGLASGTRFAVLYHVADGVYSAVVEPATTEMADADYAFLGWQATSTTGTYPTPTTPPGGYGGGGSSYDQYTAIP